MRTVDWYKLVLNFFELAAFLTGLACWKKYAGTYWKYFILFLGLICWNELLSWVFVKLMHDKPLNKNFFTYYGIPLQFIFYFWLFYRQFLNKGYERLRLMPVIAFAIYVASFFLELILLPEGTQKWFTSVSYTVGNLLLLVLILLYLLRFSRSAEIVHYKTSNMFWVSVGLMIFFLGSFPYYGLVNTLQKYRQAFLQYWYLSFFFNYTMYIFFSISLLWGKPK